jgi:REP element-mobilizing transposase RayT
LYVGMPRKLRIEYSGAMYHVMSRGDRREKIFLNDVDRQDFIKTLAEACQKTNWQVHAYCLMPNHYHLVLETPEPNLVAGMAWLQSRIIAQELQRQGWQEADLLVRPKNDAVKLGIAARLRRETTLSTKAIAARVHLGSSKAANRSLHSYQRGPGATGDMTNGTTRNDPSYGLTPLPRSAEYRRARKKQCPINSISTFKRWHSAGWGSYSACLSSRKTG